MARIPPPVPAAAAALLFCACASAPRPAALDDLVGTWQLVGVEVPMGARIPTLAVTGDGRVQGTSGVNRYASSLDRGALAAGRWQVRPAATTRMAGPEAAMQFEAAFLRALGEADRAVVAGERLLLEQEGRTLLTFGRVTLR